MRNAQLLAALIGPYPLALFQDVQNNAEVRAVGGFWVWDVQTSFTVAGDVLHHLGAVPTGLAAQVEAHLLTGTVADPVVGTVTIDARGRGRALYTWTTTTASTNAPPRPLMRTNLAILPSVEGAPTDDGVGGGGLAFSRVAGATAVVPLPFTEAP